jgi:putative peptide maturation system protein
MLEANDCIALEVNDESVSLYEVLRLAKLTDRLQIFQDAIEAQIIDQEGARRGIVISAEALQQAADDFRIANELHDADTTEQWLAAHYLSYEDWECLIEAQCVREKLRQLLTADRVEQHFAENRLSFDTARISRLVLDDEEIARELRAQIVEDGADFYGLARQFSIDLDTRLAGGYLGQLRRADLEAAVEAAVFGAQPPAVVGPLKSGDGWELIRVEALMPALLDDSLRATISQQLFAEWLGEQSRKARISLPLLTPASAGDPNE